MRRVPRRARGFTLVEILVVMVIIGVIIAGAMLSLSFLGADRELDTEGERLSTLMNYAQEQANLQTRELGLYCISGGYLFLAFDAITNQWQPVTGDEALRPRTLPDGLQLQLNIDGQDVQLKDSAPAATSAPASSAASAPRSLSYAPPRLTGSSGPDAQPALQPQVMIFSNGDLSTFRLTLSRDGAAHSVQLKPDRQGHVSASEPGKAGT